MNQLNKLKSYYDDNKKVLKPLLVVMSFILSFFFIYISYIIFKPLNMALDTQDGQIAKAYGIILIFFVILGAVILKLVKKKLTTQNWIVIIFLLGFITRLTYMLYTGRYTRQYDTWVGADKNGHYDYATYIYENWSLPNHAFDESKVYQFYHPPLNYFIQAVFMKFFNAITMNQSLKTDTADLFASCQILATFYTSLIAYFGYKIITLFDCSNKTKLLVSSFVILFPRLIQLSGQLNNDVLAILFVFISMYYIYKWYKNEDKKTLDFVLGGLFFGLAMACKLSAVTVAIGYVVIFLIEFIKSIKKKEHCAKLSTLILQYSLFIVICAPIGLWFQFYSHYVYGLPYNFVYRALGGDLYTGTRAHVLANSDIFNISAFDNTNSGLVYTNGFVNFLVRYVIPFYPKDFAQSFIYCNSRTTFNILTYALKSAIFGEFSFWRGEGYSLIAVFSIYVSYFCFLIAIGYDLIKRFKEINKEYKFSLYLILSVVIFYIYLQISMPFGCSMDFRYIVPVIVPVAICILNHYEITNTNKTKFTNIFNPIFSISLITFLISSNLFYFDAI